LRRVLTAVGGGVYRVCLGAFWFFAFTLSLPKRHPALFLVSVLLLPLAALAAAVAWAAYLPLGLAGMLSLWRHGAHATPCDEGLRMRDGKSDRLVKWTELQEVRTIRMPGWPVHELALVSGHTLTVHFLRTGSPISELCQSQGVRYVEESRFGGAIE